jgi:hypothetical protein
MKKRYLRVFLGILGIAGIIAFALYPNDKSYECLEPDLPFYPYGNPEWAGMGVAGNALAFKCVLSEESENCGAGISFSDGMLKSENWNLADSLVLEMESANLEELIVQVLSLDPDHTEIEDRSTMKPMLKEITIRAGQHASPNPQRHAIYMPHFYTPDYWYEQQGAKERGNLKRFSAIAGLEIFTGWKNKTGIPIELKIKSICTESHSNLPFVILVLYLGILIAVAIGTRLTMIQFAEQFSDQKI